MGTTGAQAQSTGDGLSAAVLAPVPAGEPALRLSASLGGSAFVGSDVHHAGAHEERVFATPQTTGCAPLSGALAAGLHAACYSRDAWGFCLWLPTHSHRWHLGRCG